MEFGYDETKHGLYFLEAQKVWMDVYRVEIPARLQTEPRYLVIGRINEEYWSVIVTYRNQKVRIISVRRSRKEEIEVYES